MSGCFKIVGLTKISEHWGESDACFLVEFHCEVECENSAGGEAFKATFVSPEHLRSEIKPGDIEVGRGYLIAHEYDEKKLKDQIQRLLDGSGASSWPELSQYVDRYFDWV